MSALLIKTSLTERRGLQNGGVFSPNGTIWTCFVPFLLLMTPWGSPGRAQGPRASELAIILRPQDDQGILRMISS